MSRILNDLARAEKLRDRLERDRLQGRGKYHTPYVVVELDHLESKPNKDRYWVGAIGQLKWRGASEIPLEIKERFLKEWNEPLPELKLTSLHLTLTKSTRQRLELFVTLKGLQNLGVGIVELLRSYDLIQPVRSPFLENIEKWKPIDKGNLLRPRRPISKNFLHVEIPACVRVELERLKIIIPSLTLAVADLGWK